MTSSSDKQADMSDKPIEKAEKIIELFGGIRPMASKMDIAVTTVQGWKKRNVIPANRRNQILKTAHMHKIDLSSYMQTTSSSSSSAAEQTPQPIRHAAASSSRPISAQANENNQPQRIVSPKAPGSNDQAAMEKTRAAAKIAAAKKNAADGSQSNARLSKNTRNTQDELRAMAHKSMKRNFMVTGSLIMSAVFFGLFIFNSGDVTKVENDISSLQENVASLEGRTSMLEQIVPENLSENLQQIRSEATLLGQQVGGLAQNLTDTLGAEGSGSMMDRIVMLEQQISTSVNGDMLQGLMTRIDSMSATVDGQQDLSTAMGELSMVVQGMQGQMDGIDGALERAKQDNEALAEALEGVTGRDLGAAAMLMALGHVRNSFNRNNAFEEDLLILQGLVGTDDPELNEAIDRLAPYAAEGVLSTETLSDELKTISGNILMAKMAGQDISFQQEALQRFGEVVALSKNGVPVVATPEEEAILRAQQLLDEGDVQGAMAELNALEGAAADAAAPWMEQAEGNVAAQNLEAVILQEVLSKVQGLGGSGLGGGLLSPSGKVYIDPNTGRSIMTP